MMVKDLTNPNEKPIINIEKALSADGFAPYEVDLTAYSWKLRAVTFLLRAAQAR